MSLSFVPRGKTLIPVPGELTTHNQAPRRVCAQVRAGEWVIMPTPLTVPEGTQVATGLVRMAQRGDLLPADAATAAVCGVPYQPVEYVSPSDGWRVAQTTASQRRQPAKE